jgi:hypothetical protein
MIAAGYRRSGRLAAGRTTSKEQTHPRCGCCVCNERTSRTHVGVTKLLAEVGMLYSQGL